MSRRRPENKTSLLDAQDVRLLQASYDKLWRIRDEAALIFYDALFALAPDTRDLFKGDMAVQRRQFMSALGHIVTEIEKPDVLHETLKSVALKHVGYGVLPHHYDQVGAAMVHTIQQTLGPRFVPVWRTAYGMMSEMMRREAYPPDTQAASRHG